MTTGIEFARTGDFLDEVTEAHPAGDAGTEPFAALVARFAALELAPGSVVIVLLPNSKRLLRVFFAAVLCGLTPALLTPSTPPARVRDIAHWLGAAAVLRAGIRDGDYGATGVLRGAEADIALLGSRTGQRHPPGHVILMTSGTSGLTTGCLHSVDSLLRNARRHTAAVGQRQQDTVLVSLPVYYSYALVAQVLGCLVTGSRLLIGGAPFTVTDYLGTVSGGVTVSSLTPILVKKLLRHNTTLPIPLRTLTVGGQALPPRYTAELLKHNKQLELYLTYGLTEAGPRVATLAAHREPPHRYGSIGTPLDEVSLATRDAAGGRELLVHSDTIYRARVGEPAPSKRGQLLEPGLLATGDIGRLDSDGYFYLRGRSTDFATIRGEKVSTAGLRRAAESLPYVVRAAASVTDADPDLSQLALDVYVDAPVPPTDAEIQRQLRTMLTRNERPAVLRVHTLSAGEAHK